MRSIAMLGALAVFAAAPVAAQGNFRTGGIDPTRRAPTTTRGGVLGDILGRDTARVRTQSRKSDHIPPGQRPPAGMCRVWIDGVPPGQQPAPTDCQTAVATKPANARVIWGDQTAFPGKGKGKFKEGKKNENRVNGRDRDDDDDDEFDDDRDEGRRGGRMQGRRDDRDDDRDEARNGQRGRTRDMGGVLRGNSKSVAKRGKKG